MIGTAEELAAQGITIPKPIAHARGAPSPLQRVIDAVA